MVIVAATSVERKPLRRALPQARIVLAGVALANLHEDLGDTVLSCGLAGGLRPGLPTGTLLLPREVRRPGGATLRCDEALIEALAQGARRLGIEPVFDPLLTAESIVNGDKRAYWAQRGFAGVDMETGRLSASRVAAVRVILDTPENEISADWAVPWRALLKPSNWPQARWLAREAPRAAALAAAVVAAAHLPAQVA